MSWIELHDSMTDNKIFVNIKKIKCIYLANVSYEKTVTKIDMEDGTKYSVKEKYDMLKDFILDLEKDNATSN